MNHAKTEANGNQTEIVLHVRRAALFGAFAGLLLGRAVTGQSVPPEEIVFETSDGLTIYGDLYAPNGDTMAPIVLLFHQGGGAARAEYEPIVGALTQRGIHALAIDQRRGGTRLGGRNRTVDGLGAVEYSYCEVYPDLEGALDFVITRGYRGPRILWGSSYSAALVFQLATRRSEDVTGVLAFSPASGEPMSGCQPERYSPGLTLPVLVVRPLSEVSIEAVRLQVDQFRADSHQVYIADPGVHGSSVLNEARVGASTIEHWNVVWDFLLSLIEPLHPRP